MLTRIQQKRAKSIKTNQLIILGKYLTYSMLLPFSESKVGKKSTHRIAHQNLEIV